MVCAPEQHGGKVPVPEITSHVRLLIRDRGQMHFVVGRIRGLERSPLPRAAQNRPRRRVFRSSLAELQMEKDSMAERGEFELPVPICEQSDDSIRLSFATSRRTAKRYRPAAHF